MARAPGRAFILAVEHDITLSGHGFRLEPLTHKHVGELAAMVDAALWAGMASAMPVGEVGMMNYIEDAQALAGCYAFAVVDAVSDEVRGSTALIDHQVGARRVEIGRTFYDRAVWGRVVNPACKFLLLEHAFERLGVHRVELRADARNLRSLAAIERLGATREGPLRGYRDGQDGARVDSVGFSILAPEWAAVREGLLGRIDPLRAIAGLGGPDATALLDANGPAPLATVGASMMDAPLFEDHGADLAGEPGVRGSRRGRVPRGRLTRRRRLR